MNQLIGDILCYIAGGILLAMLISMIRLAPFRIRSRLSNERMRALFMAAATFALAGEASMHRWLSAVIFAFFILNEAVAKFRRNP